LLGPNGVSKAEKTRMTALPWWKPWRCRCRPTTVQFQTVSTVTIPAALDTWTWRKSDINIARQNTCTVLSFSKLIIVNILRSHEMALRAYIHKTLLKW